LKQGPLTQLATFFNVLTMKNIKNRHSHVPFMLSATILAQWRHPVASSEALDLLHWAICVVLYRRTSAAIEMASKTDPFFCHRFVCCCPGGRWGDTEQVVARWRPPVASGVALDMPHQAMPSVLLWRICKAFEMAHDGGAF
jgi:hypothetical protein